MSDSSVPSGLIPVIATLLIAACGNAGGPPQRHAVTIMTFNVENLFDTEDDAGKDDRTYLPLAAKQNAEHRAACGEIEVERWREQCLDLDWSEELLERKLEVVAEAILQVGDGRGADVIALQEVENRAILERLRTGYLGAADYLPSILIEGNDDRGIDVAFLSRLPQAEPPTLHEIRFENVPEERVADTRGILQANFELPDGTVLTGYAVHFPAPFHPTEMRIAAYEALNRLQAELPADRPAFAAGDFNTTSAEDAEKNMLARFAEPAWTVTHRVGCDGCPGTQYYAPNDSWSFLDMILWSSARRGANTTWSISADSVQLANLAPDQTKKDGTPRRFDAESGTGVSDHWPLVATLESN